MSGHRIRRQLLLAVLALIAATASDAATFDQHRPDKLVFVFSRPRTNPHAQWLIRLYTEALGRLSIGFEFLDVPPTRATALSSTGLVDGELGRTYEFAALYPSLVRVEEANNEVLFSAFALKPMPALDGWAALRQTAFTWCHRQGIQEIEREVADAAHGGRTTNVNTIASGFRMLQRERVDLYVEVDNAVAEFLASSEAQQADLAGLQPIRVGVMLRTTGHAYLHERHRALAPALAAVLRAMKAEGLHERYLAEAFLTARQDDD